MINDRLKELIPELERYSISGTVQTFHNYAEVQQQTENLRKAVKALIEILGEAEDTIGGYDACISDDESKLYRKTIEQITGQKYSEI